MFLKYKNHSLLCRTRKSLFLLLSPQIFFKKKQLYLYRIDLNQTHKILKSVNNSRFMQFKKHDLRAIHIVSLLFSFCAKLLVWFVYLLVSIFSSVRFNYLPCRFVLRIMWLTQCENTLQTVNLVNCSFSLNNMQPTYRESFL